MSGAIAVAFGNRFAGAPNYTPSTSLTTPTFEGSGETTEPTWRVKPSWATGVTATDLLAHNPLPSGDDDYENPSLLISNNQGSTWSNPPSLTNPIAAKPTAIGAAGNNADCFLLPDPNTNRLIMFWNVFSDPNAPGGVNQNGVWYSICTATNLGTWSARALLFNHNGVGAQQIGNNEQEPKVVWDPTRNRFLFFTQDMNTGAIRMRVSATTDPLGTYGTAVVCNIALNDPSGVWHMDIIRETTGRFVMVLCDTHNAGTLERQGWLASSLDGINWKVAPRPFMKANAWAINGVYRPSIIPARDGSASYDVITSRHQTPTGRLGLTRNIPKTEIP